MRVLVAFDKFKDALAAAEACAIAQRTIRRLRPTWRIDCCPLADGGDGFASILTSAAGGQWQVVDVTGPRPDRRIRAGFGLVTADSLPGPARRLLEPVSAVVGVVEMASASGLALLAPSERDPWRTSSVGTGELIRAAAIAGADTVLLGVGGSATHDLALGALVALGWSALDEAGAPCGDLTPAHWHQIERLLPGSCRVRLPQIHVACDVDNPLLGQRGAAAVFGPQKGLRAEDQDRLEAATERMAHKLLAAAQASAHLIDRAGAGAAGGTAFGLMAGLHAHIIPGFDLVSAWLDVDRRLQQADVVLTGEGRFDASSLTGKGPGELARRAAALKKPIAVIAGRVALEAVPPGWAALSLTTEDEPLSRALPETAVRLEAAVAQWLDRCEDGN